MMRQLGSSPSHMKTQIQYKKIFCAYHPTQFLTNFCLQKQCLMPLCPSCVVQHTEQHYQAKQKPTYINLNDALSQVKTKCYEQVNQLQEYYRINVLFFLIGKEQIMNYIDGLRVYIKKQLIICKETVFDHITVLFDEYEAVLFKQIVERYRQQEVYNFHQSTEVKASILENIESLYDKTAQIKGEQCLSALIKYYGEDEEIIDSNLEVIKEYLEKNKNAGGIHIGLDQDNLVEMFKGMCDRVICLKTVTEKDLLEEATSSKNRKNQPDPTNKKPITISARLRSPLGPNKKNPSTNKSYESPFKQKPFKPDRQTMRNNKQFFNSGM